MKAFKIAAAAVLCGVLFFTGCFAGNGGTGDEEEPNADPIVCNVFPVSYEEVNVETDMAKFLSENKTDGKRTYGFVESVWHRLKVNGAETAVYSARCGQNVHSFAWVDVQTNAQDGALGLDVRLDLLTKDKSEATVLPEKNNVSATYDDGAVSAVLNGYGSHTFVFDKSPDKALTLYVAPYSESTLPVGWSERKIQAGEYTREQTTFTESNTLYRFESGVYDLNAISLPSNSILYFERGAYVRVHEEFEGDYYAALASSRTENVTVCGRAVFDFSDCTGGDNKTKGVYSFDEVKNLSVEGLISVNSNGWTMCASACENAWISRCMFFGYRTFSDGIMLSDCMDSGARDNFVRTGDDAIEVKSFSGNADPNVYTRNVLYENNCVWTDKGIAYGCIYESRKTIDGVYFRNNSVGFAQAAWSDHLGCAVMQMGSQKGTVWQNVYFEKMEVYSASCALVSIFNRAVNEEEGGVIKNVFCKDLVLKYAAETQRPVSALSVVIRLGEGVSGSNCKINNIRLDNVTFAGTALTALNLADYASFSIAEGATFSKSTIKINEGV